MISVEPEAPNRPAHRARIGAKLAVVFSWLIVSTAGAVILTRAKSPTATDEARRQAAALFVVFMTNVHALGYLKYNGQFRDDRQRSDPLLEKYVPALKMTAIQQGILVTLAALMLDMGEAIHIAIMATLAYWMMFALIIARRQELPTRTDLHAIRWGFLYIYVAVGIVAPLWWAHVGRTY